MENQRPNRGGFEEEEEDHGGIEIELPLPPGFRFHPTDEELIIHYLTNKALNANFSATAIGDVDLNKCEPWDLPLMAKMGEKEWYFFCVRDRKYPTGLRTNRATNSGYWKATGKDKEICSSKGINSKSIMVVGMKKTLVFYQGRAPKGEKSNWVMHEYRLEGKFKTSSAQNEWVICRVFEKSSSPGGGVGNNKIHVVNSSGGHNYFENKLIMDYSSPLLPPLMDSSPPKQQNGPCFISEPIRIPSYYEEQQQSYLKALFENQGASQETAGSQSLEIGERRAVVNEESNPFISGAEFGNFWNY